MFKWRKSCGSKIFLAVPLRSIHSKLNNGFTRTGSEYEHYTIPKYKIYIFFNLLQRRFVIQFFDRPGIQWFRITTMHILATVLLVGGDMQETMVEQPFGRYLS